MTFSLTLFRLAVTLCACALTACRTSPAAAPTGAAADTSTFSSAQTQSAHPPRGEPSSNKTERQTVGKLADFEAALHGFPAFLDSQGKKLGDGEFAQWIEGQQLHVRITYDFGSGHVIEEQAIFRQEPEFIQDHWSWRELRGGQIYRQF